jgi:gliding motility-associated-like protein
MIMKRTIYSILLLFLPILGIAQQLPVSAFQTLAVSGEDLIEKYHSYQGAVLNMTREEWDIFRAWDGYDEEAVVRIVQEYKAPFMADRAERKAARIARSSDCDCWIEPDNTYSQITTTDWVESGGAGVDVDSWAGPFGLNGWSYNLYGQLFNSFYLTSKGTVAFGAGYIDWTPDEFPGATYNQIAGYWADSDFRTTGELWYKVTPEAVYVNYIDLGYFNNHGDKVNNFQIIFTPDGSTVVPDGNNVQLCYLDMQWAHGDVGGSGGFGGPNPGNVGVDRATTTGSHIQFGRFNLNSNAYNGPYGAGNQQQDGINWLDNKVFNINTLGSAQSNIPPIPTAAFGCDTVRLCLNDTLDFNMQFLPPETNQQVSITIDVDGDASGLFTTSLQNGALASFVGGFVGNAGNVGLHTITVTGTDNGNPAASSSVSVVVEVIPIEIPPLTVSGIFTVCAGGETEITASPGFDSYQWSTGCDEQSCVITGGGQFQVTGFLDVCSTSRLFEVEATPYFLPCITIEPNPICSDETATVTVCPEDQALFVDYQWEGNWNGLGGNVVTETGPVAEVTPGTFRLLVEDEEGCFGQRVFIVESIDAFIPDDTWSGAYCDGLENVAFTGGFSNPAAGQFTMYFFSSDDAGWNGSYVNVIIDGDVVATLTSSSSFVIHQIPIEANQFIELEYISSGQGADSNYSIQLFNCANANSATINNMSQGIVYAQNTGCTAQPAFGTWSIASGPAGGSFTVTNQFNTVFTPGGYGLYEICFAEATCAIDYCYELEYTLAPSISLNEDEVLLCGDESFTFVATVEDIGNTGTIDWPSPATDDVLSNTFSYNTPQDLDLTVTITNGCGTAEADFNIVAQFEPNTPVLEDQILCDGGSIALIAAINPSDDLNFAWTFNGANAGSEPNLTATQTGTYCVTVTNQCFPNQAPVCADLSIAGEIDNPLPIQSAFCNGQSPALVVADIPSLDWIVEWPDGSIGNTYEVTANGEVCALVTDPGNCGTTEYCTNVYIGTAPTVTPSPNELIILCPEITNAFNLNSPNGIVYNWSINCNAGITLTGNNSLNLNSSQLDQACWGNVLTITGSTENPCGTASAQFEVLIDACAITIPNIFTPNGDAVNESFLIDGLEVYSDVQLWVFNRWGNTVYESQDYQNGTWRGDDLSDGTYWYVLILPNGLEHKGTVNISR